MCGILGASFAPPCGYGGVSAKNKIARILVDASWASLVRKRVRTTKINAGIKI
jgi:hypothetical protein